MALKPAEIYGAAAALRAKCPPTSSQAQFYTDVAQIILDILADADVSPISPTPMTTPTGGPVAGLGKIV